MQAPRTQNVSTDGNGAPERVRRDLQRVEFMALADMGQRGVEPRTSRLSGVRSNHLSYWPCSSFRNSLGCHT